MTENLLKLRSKINFDILRGDKTIWTIYFIFSAISLVEVYSAASRLTYRSGDYLAPFRDHLTYLIIGLIIVIVTHNIPCRWFKIYPIIAGLLSGIMLLFLLARGVMVNGAARWINIGGISVQPSELAKGSVVIFIAFILSFMQTENGADRHAFKWILFTSVPFCVLIVFENLSTAGILFIVTIMMMFIGRVSLLQIGKLFSVLAILGISVIFAVKSVPQESLNSIPKLHRLNTWVNRIMSFSDPKTKELLPEDFDIDKDAQEAHAHIAIATSSLVGKFPGNSVERDFLSQASSDFIFAIIIEEMGLIGGIAILLLYIMFLFRAARIANRCERNFPAFLVLGLTLLLVTQAFLNMAVAVGAFPITGQPLPFISKGGSSTLINCLYLGMILSVSRFAKRREIEKLPQQVDTPMNEAEFVNDEGIK